MGWDGTGHLWYFLLSRGQGGESQFADGFAVAERMRRDHPEEWDVLTTVPVEFWDKGVAGGDANWLGHHRVDHFHKVLAIPTFQLNSRGDLHQVRFNNAVRSSSCMVAGDMETTGRLYRALRLFNDLCYHEDHLVQIKLKEGEGVFWDNLRVLHGRNGFRQEREENEEGRQLSGTYLDWDEVYSTMNVLREKFSK